MEEVGVCLEGNERREWIWEELVRRFCRLVDEENQENDTHAQMKDTFYFKNNNKNEYALYTISHPSLVVFTNFASFIFYTCAHPCKYAMSIFSITFICSLGSLFTTPFIFFFLPSPCGAQIYKTTASVMLSYGNQG